MKKAQSSSTIADLRQKIGISTTDGGTADTRAAKVERRKSIEYAPVDSIRTGLTAADIKQAFVENLLFGMGRAPAVATKHDAYIALAMTVRDRLLRRCVRTAEAAAEKGARIVCYFSA